MWFVTEGWLSVLDLAVLLLILLLCLNQRARLYTLEWQFRGLIGRISDAYRKIEGIGRRSTGEFEGNEDSTKLRKVRKGVKRPEDFDDRDE